MSKSKASLQYPQRFLIIEDSYVMRQWLHSTLMVAGAKHVDVSATYHDALNHIRIAKPSYDVVLCDYILSDTRDGQQLLEEVRRTRLLPPHTIWLMITAEGGYSQVVAAAELVPDDYLLKPISPKDLQARIDKSWRRNQDLLIAKGLLHEARYQDCHTHCMNVIRSGNTQFPLDHLKIQGEALLSAKDYSLAADHYRALLARRSDLAWARLGLARSKLHLDHYDEAMEILEELKADMPDYLMAQDVLAQVHAATDNHQASLSLLKSLIAANKKSLHRHRALIRVAINLGDTSTMIDAYSHLHTHGFGSSYLTPGDFSHYAILLSGHDAPDDAEHRLNKLEKDFNRFHMKDPGFSIPGHVLKFAKAKLGANYGNMQSAYHGLTAAAPCEELDSMDVEQRISLFACAIDMGDIHTAKDIAQKHYSDHYGNDRMCSHLDEFIPVNQIDGFRLIRQLVEQRIVAQESDAIQMVVKGDLVAAQTEFMRLAEAYDKLDMLLKTCMIILRRLNYGAEVDMAESLKASLRRYIARAKIKDPDSPRLNTLIRASARHLSNPTP